jgi:hypothetical protein
MGRNEAIESTHESGVSTRETVSVHSYGIGLDVGLWAECRLAASK